MQRKLRRKENHGPLVISPLDPLQLLLDNVHHNRCKNHFSLLTYLLPFTTPSCSDNVHCCRDIDLLIRGAEMHTAHLDGVEFTKSPNSSLW